MKEEVGEGGGGEARALGFRVTEWKHITKYTFTWWFVRPRVDEEEEEEEEEVALGWLSLPPRPILLRDLDTRLVCFIKEQILVKEHK